MKRQWLLLVMVAMAVCVWVIGSTQAQVKADTEVTTVWPLNKAWVEPGGTVTDNVDGTIPWDRVKITGTVTVTKAGTYDVWYQVMDSSGNQGTAVRHVQVKDQTPPVITLK